MATATFHRAYPNYLRSVTTDIAIGALWAAGLINLRNNEPLVFE